SSCSYSLMAASSVLRMMSMYFMGFSLVRGVASASLYYPCRTRGSGIDNAREVFLRGRRQGSRPLQLRRERETDVALGRHDRVERHLVEHLGDGRVHEHAGPRAL